MNKQFDRRWEERERYARVKTRSLPDTPGSESVDVWGARINTTLLQDLSEQERSRLAEHEQSCSACAKRLQEYDLLEEFAAELPEYDLRPAAARVESPVYERRRTGWVTRWFCHVKAVVFAAWK